MPRAIIHLDMDAFYASVEELDFPELSGQPVIVGGSLDRGVVCACSYPARRYGVHSAMSMAKATRLCPQAVIRPVRMKRYREVSRQIFALFAEFTDRIEPLSIDEAFLDVSDCRRLHGEPLTIAKTIITRVKQQTGLTVSAGVAPNKFLAKLVSARCKPAGLEELKPDQIDGYLAPLPVEVLWGVGRKTAEKLQHLGIRQVAELRQLDREYLRRHFGQAGGVLYDLCRGIDTRQVVSTVEAQSMGAEATFATDLYTPAALQRELLKLAVEVSGRVRGADRQGRKLVVKIKYADFSQMSRHMTLAVGIDTTEQVYQLARQLLHDNLMVHQPVRLLGIYLADLVRSSEGLQQLFGREQERYRALDKAIDTLQQRFGAAPIKRATLLEAEGSDDPGKADR